MGDQVITKKNVVEQEKNNTTKQNRFSSGKRECFKTRVGSRLVFTEQFKS